MQKSKQVAKNYAQALMELAAKDLTLKETFLNEIKIINESINQATNAKKTFQSPVVSHDEKKELIKKIFSGKLNSKVLNFLFLLIDKHRFNLLPEIQDHLNKLVNKEKGIVIAEVSSVIELDSTTLEDLKQQLESILKKSEKVTIESKIEPSLIGGLKVRVNDFVYDSSIKGRLENLKRRLEN